MVVPNILITRGVHEGSSLWESTGVQRPHLIFPLFSLLGRRSLGRERPYRPFVGGSVCKLPSTVDAMEELSFIASLDIIWSNQRWLGGVCRPVRYLLGLDLPNLA